ncbi:MAG: hypothetical protein GXP42_11085 [Chloroflexi bacterium]|nr:hypothetical protein [Chloroflexota bacterium]
MDVNRRAIHLLYKELGIVDAVRFMRQFAVGFGDYTEERDILFADQSLEDILAEIAARRSDVSVVKE